MGSALLIIRCCGFRIQYNSTVRMSRTQQFPKDAGPSTFYSSYNSEAALFATKRRAASANAEAIEALSIECDGRVEKLKERVALDERKVERNYLELEQLKQEIEQECARLASDREVEGVAKARKEAVKDTFADCKAKTAFLNQKAVQEVTGLTEGLAACEREVQREREQRETSMVRLIDEFEAEMLGLERQLKQIRTAEEEVFEQLEVGIYNLEQSCSERLETEADSRKREHETIIKLVGECIENFRFIY